MMNGGDVMTDVSTQVDVKTGRMCKVILKNDDTTEMTAVVIILLQVFQKNELEAVGLMLQAHKQGKALIAIMPKKLARAKRVEAMRLANQLGYPDFTIDIEEAE